MFCCLECATLTSTVGFVIADVSKSKIVFAQTLRICGTKWARSTSTTEFLIADVSTSKMYFAPPLYLQPQMR